MSAVTVAETSSTLGSPAVRVDVVTGLSDIEAYGAILAEQRRWIEGELGLDVLVLQPGNAEEYADAQGYYRRTGTVPLLARAGRHPLGICALKPVPGAGPVLELKRMFVRSGARGLGVGRALAVAAVDTARRVGARRVVLETHEGLMPRAAALYRSLGFTDAAPLGVTRHPDVSTMGLDLVSDGAGTSAPIVGR